MSNEIRPEDIRRIAAAKERQVLGEEGLRRFLQPGTTIKGDPPPLDPGPRVPQGREHFGREPSQPAPGMALPRRAATMPRGPYDDVASEPPPEVAGPAEEPLRSDRLRAEPPVSYPDDAEDEQGPTRFRPEDFSDYDVEPIDQPRRWRRFLPMSIGLAALIGFAGVIYYAYQWSGSDSPDAGGEAPIIRADVEPIKVKPSEEGGEAVANQDSTVLNPDAASGKTEVLMPPPEEPSPAAIEETQVASTAPAVPSAPPAPPAPDVVTLSPSPAPSTGDTSGASAIPPAPPPPPAPEALTSPAVEPAPLPEPEPTTTEVAGLATSAAVQPDATSGAYLIQLASLTEEGAVSKQWAKLQAKYPDLLSDMGLKVQPAVVNGTQYYRLQAGPLPNKATAEDMCAQLKALKQDCLLVKN